MFNPNGQNFMAANQQQFQLQQSQQQGYGWQGPMGPMGPMPVMCQGNVVRPNMMAPAAAGSPVPNPETGAVAAPWQFQPGDMTQNPSGGKSMKKVQYEDDEDECSICILRSKSLVMLGCKHYPFCNRCIKEMSRQAAVFRCPTCRKRVRFSEIIQISKKKPVV